MGIDWYPYKPKPGADRQRIAVLAKIQGDTFQAMPEMWNTDPLPPYSCEQHDRDLQDHRELYEAYRSASEELSSLIDFGMSEEYPEYVDSFRVGPMASWVFPPQWRTAAYRTILADELPGQLRVWESWINAVRQGRLRRYLLELYLYEMTMELFWAWGELRESAEYVAALTNAWTRRPHCVAVREEIAQLPRPTVIGAPVHVPEDDQEQKPTGEQLATLKIVEEQAKTYRRIARQWCRNTRNVQCGYYSLHDFAGYLEFANDPLVDEFFAWARKWESRKYGLYLDY